MAILYEDPTVTVDSDGVTIHKYHFPTAGDKRLLTRKIVKISSFELKGINGGNWRIWGSGDFKHWFALDTKRPRKKMAYVIDKGEFVRACLTPDDPEAFEAAVAELGFSIDRVTYRGG